MGRPRTLPEPQPRACAHCGTVFTPKRSKWRQKYCSLACNGRAFCNPEHNRRIARIYNPLNAAKRRGTGQKDGYVKLGGRHMHRVVMEDKLGRPLKPGEIVHHVDEDKKNNAPDNLELMPSQSEHARLHARKTFKPMSHRRCGQERTLWDCYK